MNIKEIIKKAFENAKKKRIESSNIQKRNRNRSKEFVEQLAANLRSYYKDNKYVTFSKHYSKNRKKFGLNELLYDILVCEIASIQSPNNKELSYITKSIWQVESEFAKNTREAIYDFNKLVIGSSENKLFIGPIVNNINSFLNIFIDIAEKCNSQTYVALVSPPSDWNNNDLIIMVFKYFNKFWQEIK